MNKELTQIARPFYRVVRGAYYFPLNFYRHYKNHELSDVQKQFANNLKFFKADTNKEKTNGILLVQMVENYEYTIKLAAASKALAKKNNLQVNFYNVLIDWIKEKKNKTALYEKLITNKLVKIHSAFGNDMIFDNAEMYADQPFIKNKLNEIISALDKNNGDSVLGLKFDDIPVGDLIYDTYLRFFHKPTLEKIDKEVMHTIEVALNVFYNFKLFLKSNNVKVLLNTYSSYIHHGIPARICLHNNIEVYSIGSYSYIAQKLSKEFPYHLINHTLFSPDKKLSALQLDSARQIFISRFEGEIDPATSYMRQTSYSDIPTNMELKKLFAEKPRNIIIYVHDFYDSPHIDRMLQFPDLYQYLKYTIDKLTEVKDTNVFVKTHPNGIEGCKEKTIELVNSYNKSHFHILDESVSNLNVVELKPDLICTARGTIGIEMAYFGIPTVALYDNSYANFNFVHTCMDKESYFEILKGEKKPEIDFDKEKIYSFYYQAYLEKSAHHENNIFNVLHSYKGFTYDDKYLEFILSHSKEIFSDKFLAYYSNAVN